MDDNQPLETAIEKEVPLPRMTLTQRPDVKEKLVAAVVENAISGAPRTRTKTVRKVLEEEGIQLSELTIEKEVAKLSKHPAVVSALEAHKEQAQRDLIEIAGYTKNLGKTGGKDGAAYASVALGANKEILDRTMGKAKQTIDVTQRAVTVNIDLTAS